MTVSPAFGVLLEILAATETVGATVTVGRVGITTVPPLTTGVAVPVQATFANTS